MEKKKDITIKVPVKVVSAKKRANVAKELRLAHATTGSEKQKHLERADKLLTRYGL